MNINFFSNTIKKRKKYLDSLFDLSDDWIGPGESYAPSDKSIFLAKIILDNLLSSCSKRYYSLKKGSIPSIGKVLCGPIPCGGISIEIRLSGKQSIFYEIYDNIRMNVIFVDDKGNYYSALGKSEGYRDLNIDVYDLINDVFIIFNKDQEKIVKKD